jgi:hypothetical protein
MLMSEFEGDAARTSELSAAPQPADLAAQPPLGGCVAPSAQEFVDAWNLARRVIGSLARAATGRRAVAVHQPHRVTYWCKNGAQSISA